MVDRLKTTEPVSQGARSVRFEPDTKDRFCMHQTAKLQYHYYHTSGFDFPLCSFFCYTENKSLVRVAIYATTMPKDTCSTSYGGPERLLDSDGR